MGYSQWQVEKDSGSDVNTSFNPKDQVHAAGDKSGWYILPGTRLSSFMGSRNLAPKPGLRANFLRGPWGKSFFKENL